ncbi:MAG: GNAT family N-acetyltransferase [Chloroflexota bacterium]
MKESISLAYLNESHISALAKIANNPKVSETSGVPLDCSENDVREWLDENNNRSRNEITFVIMVNQKVAGCCILKKVDMDSRSAELAYWLGVDFWGRGIGTKAALTLRDMAFDLYNLDYLHSHFLKSSNGASGGILTKLGFEADQSRADLPVEGRFTRFEDDVWTFVILAREKWQTIQASEWTIHSNQFTSR